MCVKNNLFLKVLCLSIFFSISLHSTGAKSKSSNFDYNSLFKNFNLKEVSIKHVEIKSGDTLYSILKRFKFSPNQVNHIISRKVLPKHYTMIPGTKFRVIRKKGVKPLLGLKFFDPNEDVAYLFWKNKSRVGAKEIKENYKHTKHKVSGKISGSILSSITSKIDDQWLAYRFIDAYALNYNLRKVLKKNAKFSFVFQKKYDGPFFVKFGEILETNLEINGRNIKRVFVPFNQGGSFVGVKANRKRPLYAPVEYLRISSTYRPRRFHPIKRRRVAHLGVDFELPSGHPVYTAYAGRVLRKGRNRAAGKYVVVKHPNGLESYYNHLQTINKRIRPGQYITNGTKIGTIGCTGYCTKPHLHFAVKKRGRFVDPAKYIKSYPFRKKHIVRKAMVALGKKSSKIQ